MIIYAHRGNIDGPIASLENKPSYIDTALLLGYNVEVDVQLLSGRLFLGHDSACYPIDNSWIEDRHENLLLHCKNLASLEFFRILGYHYFWHEHDLATLTSRGLLIARPGVQPLKDSIAVLPELQNENISCCIGVCTDYAKRYRYEKGH